MLKDRDIVITAFLEFQKQERVKLDEMVKKAYNKKTKKYEFSDEDMEEVFKQTAFINKIRNCRDNVISKLDYSFNDEKPIQN